MTSHTAPTVALGADPAFVVQLDAFSGPLDLLLHLLREEQLDIADIPIARIADQFLEVIKDLGLNQAADYLEMAGRLVRLKAAMLLPRREGEEGWEDPRHELVRRLLEYQLVKEVATWLERASERRADQYQRGFLPPPPELPPPPLTLDLIALLEAVQKVISDIPSPVLHSVVARPLDTEGATKRILAMLADREEFSWIEALGPRPTIVNLLSTLLAILELAKRGAIRITQDRAFTSFMIRREDPETQVARSQAIGEAKEAAEDAVAQQKKAEKREAFLERMKNKKQMTDDKMTDDEMTEAQMTDDKMTDDGVVSEVTDDASSVIGHPSSVIGHPSSEPSSEPSSVIRQPSAEQPEVTTEIPAHDPTRPAD
jgi:segregation and condensation protein A